ncbi:hypothetical protein, partial [Limnospira fusiformis]
MQGKKPGGCPNLCRLTPIGLSNPISQPLNPSNRRKYTRPPSSPATTVTPSGAMAQELISASPRNIATSVPVSKFHTFKVLSHELEIANLPSRAIATASTPLFCPPIASRSAIAISPGAIALDADLLELRSYHQPSNLSIIPNPNGLHKDNSISFFSGVISGSSLATSSP